MTETQPEKPSPTLPPQRRTEEADRLECHRELMQFQASDFQAWRHHPLTRVVLRFLRDYRDDCYVKAFDAFLAGGLTGIQEGELRGRYAACDEIVELDWQSLCAWYGYQPEATEG